MSEIVVTIFTRGSCPLCDKAMQLLLELKNELNFTLEEINIEKNDELTEQYGLKIPVIHIDGEEAVFGNVNKIDIFKCLHKKHH